MKNESVYGVYMQSYVRAYFCCVFSYASGAINSLINMKKLQRNTIHNLGWGVAILKAF
jgi:hypothetical protein